MNLIDKAKAAKDIQTHLHILNDPNQPYFTKAQTLKSLKTLVANTAHFFTTEDLEQQSVPLFPREQNLANDFAAQSPLSDFFIGTFLNEQRLLETLNKQANGSWGFVLNSQKQLRIIAKFTAPFELIQTPFETEPLQAYEDLEVAFQQSRDMTGEALSLTKPLWITQPLDTGLVYPTLERLSQLEVHPQQLINDLIAQFDEQMLMSYNQTKAEVMHPLFTQQGMSLQSESKLVSHANSFEFLHYRDFDFHGFEQQGLDIFVWNRRAGLAEKQLFIAIRENEKGCFHDVIAFAQFPNIDALEQFYHAHLAPAHAKPIRISQIKSISLDDYVALYEAQIPFEQLWFQHAQTEWSRDAQLHWLPLSHIQLNPILKFDEDPISQYEPIFVLSDRPLNRLLYGQQRIQLAQAQQEQVVPVYLLERSEAFSWTNIQGLLQNKVGESLSLAQFKMILLESMLISPS